MNIYKIIDMLSSKDKDTRDLGEDLLMAKWGIRACIIKGILYSSGSLDRKYSYSDCNKSCNFGLILLSPQWLLHEIILKTPLKRWWMDGGVKNIVYIMPKCVRYALRRLWQHDTVS